MCSGPGWRFQIWDGNQAKLYEQAEYIRVASFSHEFRAHDTTK
jgi:hypothetical protein